ncbi:AAA domain-containing protein [Prevotella sp. tf2-5]|nr:AAA domain-containing protein [Prevotella sp. tf2-5]
MLGRELKDKNKILEEMSVKNDRDKDVRIIFESLGYSDPKMFERFIKFLDKGAFNDLDKSITSPKFRFNILGVDCVPSGEIIGIGGKPGTGKSTTLAIFVGVLLGKTSFAGIRCLTPCKKVLWIDTEKGDYSCKQKMTIFRRIANMVDNNPLEKHGVIFHQMRGERLADRIAFIDCLFAMDNYDCVVIDGIYDLTDDANDNCAPVIELLQRIVEKGTSVFAMLHTNKNDDNFRYAMGTELTRIATTIFKTDFNKNSGNHSITHDKSNDTALAPQVLFKFADDGSICVSDVSTVKVEKKKDCRTDKIAKQWQKMFADNESLSYKEIIDLFAKEGVKDNAAIQRFRSAKKKGYIENNSDGKWVLKDPEKDGVKLG